MNKAPYIVGWIGSLALAFVVGLFVGRDGGPEPSGPVIDQNVVTQARAPNENELIAANAERPEPRTPPQPAQPAPAPTVQEASSARETRPVDDFEAVEDAVEQVDDGGKPVR